MKKIVLTALFLSGLFAQRYPITLEYSFMKGCIGQDVNNKLKEKYCVCAIQYIEKNYTLNKFLTAMQDKQQSKKIISSAVNYCLKNVTK